MAEWLRAGAIPCDEQLMAELTSPEFSEGPLGLLIEKKEHMRERGLGSPDTADALSLTWAYPITTQLAAGLVGSGDHLVTHEYNPFGESELEALATGRPLPQTSRRYVAPGWPSLRHDDWSHDDLADAMASDRLRWQGDDEWQR
jgi:hypothetical protein